MKLSDDDFTSHACDDPNEENDGLGWNLDTDMTTKGKDELIQNQKLIELVEKEIKRQQEEDHQTPFVLQRLLEESRK